MVAKKPEEMTDAELATASRHLTRSKNRATQIRALRQHYDKLDKRIEAHSKALDGLGV